MEIQMYYGSPCIKGSDYQVAKIKGIMKFEFVATIQFSKYRWKQTLENNDWQLLKYRFLLPPDQGENAGIQGGPPSPLLPRPFHSYFPSFIIPNTNSILILSFQYSSFLSTFENKNSFIKHDLNFTIN